MPASHGIVDVVWCPNPLRPVADRQIKRLVLTGTDTISSVVSRLGLQGTSVIATLNASEVARKRWGRKRVRQGDTLVLLQRARGVDPATATAKFIMEFSFSYEAAVLAAYALSFATTAATALALTAVANSLMSKSRQAASEAKAALDSYSIQGGSNSLRPYAPLPLVLGEHRMFGDYASRPFAEYVPDETSVHRVINSTPDFDDLVPLAWSFSEAPGIGGTIDVTPAAPYTDITSGGVTNDPGTVHYYGDHQARSYDTPLGTTISPPHTFVVRHTLGDTTGAGDAIVDWEAYDLFVSSGSPPDWQPVDGATLPVLVGYGYLVTDHTEQLTSIFNFGIGDLQLSDFRIGSTPIEHFTSWRKDESTVPPTDPELTSLTGYTSVAYTGSDYPDDVVVVDGGKLEQRDGVINSGWVERTGRAGRYVQADVAGRLFRQGDGIEVLSCEIELEYRVAATGVWTPMFFSPVTLTNGSTTILRRTFSQEFAFDVDGVRVRRTTPEPSEARDVSELELTRVKLFKPQTALYPAQRRVGLIIKASGQLNGRIDRFSAFVQAKHWVWASGAAWTPGVYPASGAGAWVWQHTVNPAWLFLYYARGGFLNLGASAHMGVSGWLDRPDPANGGRLFGAGLTNDRIDYAAIVAWGQWCDVNGLECRMVVDEQRNAGEVLDDIAAAGRASKTWATGRLSVVWEAAGQPVVAAFGMSNIVAGSFNVGYDTDTTVHEIALQYTRSDGDYQPDTVYAAVPGVAQVVNQRAERAVYSMPQLQARRLANLLAASRYYHRRKITWESHLEALTVQRGDIVHLAHDLTQWAYSGRLVMLEVADGAVTHVLLSCKVDNPTGAGTFYLWVRKPNGVYMSVQCMPPAGPTDLVAVIGVWLAADAPGQLGGPADPGNPASDFPDTMPEDWMVLAGPTATPGKRVRITGMEPTSGRKVRLTARDEYEAFYPLEWGLGGGAPAPASGEQLVARAYNLAMDPAAAGGWRLSWELENAHGAEVSVSVNGGDFNQVPTHGVLSVLGTEVLLPAYPAGTDLAIVLMPIAAGTPVAVRGDSLTATV